MLTKLYTWLRGLLSREPVRLAIVRRYTDANGAYVGELYVMDNFAGVSGYRMVGASLDTLPLDIMDPVAHCDAERASFLLDTGNDFLAPMPPNTVRVGALDPHENDRTRHLVARLPRRGMGLVVRNGFIQHIMARKA